MGDESFGADIRCGLATAQAKLGHQSARDDTQGELGMSHVAMAFVALALAAVLSGGGAFAQTPTSGKSNMDKAIRKMKVSEDPSSPEMQQAAAKQSACKKEAKIQKLTGSARKAFMKDCTK
jgi:hypothetical protein